MTDIKQLIERAKGYSIAGVQPQVVSDLIDAIERLQAERDELISAARNTEQLLSITEPTHYIYKGLRAALAKIEGETR